MFDTHKKLQRASNKKHTQAVGVGSKGEKGKAKLECLYITQIPRMNTQKKEKNPTLTFNAKYSPMVRKFLASNLVSAMFCYEQNNDMRDEVGNMNKACSMFRRNLIFIKANRSDKKDENRVE